ncbi:MAG: hypothetical protein JSR41_07995 [Proteobacteria bacterium]|nr:hypothetical protein [Pseudomonadota bacterium]
MNQPTPAIVAQSAVRRLPRIALLMLCAAYLMPGLLGRGPWKSADVTAFGYMSALAQNTAGIARWFDPLLLGLRPETPALLPYWLGAWAIQLAPWLRPDLAVRIVFALMLWGTFTATWYAVYYLARTPRAQPVAFAFGGEARPTDYARAMADGGLLALIASLGLAQLGHETTPALAQLFFVACLFYGVAALPYRRTAPLVGLAVGSLGLALSGAPSLGLALGLGALWLAIREHRGAARDDSTEPAPTFGWPAIAGVALAVAIALLVAVALKQVHWRIALPGSHPGISAWSDWRSLIKLFIWFTWPAWPLAVWTLWRWRRQLGARHVALPLWFLLVPVAATLLTDFADRSLLLALPALATLAAFALPTFRRSVSALIDWFTLLFFSGSAVLIWLYWIAMQTGTPPKMAGSVARLAPGYVAEFSPLAFVLAVLATLVWCWLVRWRTGRHRAALWKTLVLPAGGVTLCWMLLMTLWLPALDHALSYAPQVRAIAQRTGPTRCVAELGVGRAQIAALRHHAGFELQPINSHTECDWLIVKPEVVSLLHHIVSLEDWRLIGTFRRTTNPNDDLLLYQRAPASQ